MAGVRSWARCFGALLVIPLAGCGGKSAVPRAHAPRLSDDESKCRAAALRESPLVTEWSAAEKASLQARLREGALAVEYTGCSMRPILGCRLRGSYQWQQTTLSSDTVDIRSEDELFAKLPLGAFGLEGELARSGHLQVRTMVSGQYILAGSAASDVPDYGDCAQATHLLTGVSIGSFKLHSGDSIEAGAEVMIAERGGGAKTSSSESVLREAGTFESCQQSTLEAPHIGCSSPIQAFLQPLPRFAEQRGDGTVQATFVSGNANVAWELRSDQKFVCRTPCTRWINPGETYELRSENGPELRTLQVPDLRPYVGAGNVEVVAHDKKTGAFVTGISLLGTGGGLMFMGGFLALAGGLSERSGLAVGGAVTAGVGLVALGPGLWLTVTSGAKTEVYSDHGALGSDPYAGFFEPVPRQIGFRAEF